MFQCSYVYHTPNLRCYKLGEVSINISRPINLISGTSHLKTLAKFGIDSNRDDFTDLGVVWSMFPLYLKAFSHNTGHM